MNIPAAPGAAEPSIGEPAAAPWRIGRWLLALGLLALLGLTSSFLLWQKLGNIQEQLAKQSAEAGAQALDARTLARQAQELSRDTAARVALFEARLNEIALQRTQLQELMQSLSRSRDENLVVDIESAIRLAQQQAQLTGSVEPLLAALKSADQRVLRAAQPRLSPLQRAIARDIDRIKAAVVSDTPSLLVKLDELVRLADELVLANAVLPAAALAAAKQAQIAARPSWWERSIQTLLDELRGLLRVSRIEAPEAALLSPEQSFSCARTSSSSFSTPALVFWRARWSQHAPTWYRRVAPWKNTLRLAPAKHKLPRLYCCKCTSKCSKCSCHGSTTRWPHLLPPRPGAEHARFFMAAVLVCGGCVRGVVHWGQPKQRHTFLAALPTGLVAQPGAAAADFAVCHATPGLAGFVRFFLDTRAGQAVAGSTP